MPLRSLSDVNRAFAEGRWHNQRFIKNAGTAHASNWADATFSSGQPAYDARVGVASKFTPAIAQGNDAIYLPPINSGEHRHLISGLMRSAQGGGYTGVETVILFDLLGYYPLLDGDSTDTQSMDNSLTLPRYQTGDGVSAVIINHIAPALQNGVANITVTDSLGIQRTSTVGLLNNGVNLVCSNFGNVASASSAFAMSLNAPTGVRSIDSITYTTPPGGLHVIYLVKPIATFVLGDNLLATEKNFISHNSFNAPRIFDGAWLSWASTITPGTARSISWWGDFTFAWG